MPPAETLSVSLPAEIVRLIRARVDSGDYASSSEIVREAMLGWVERERRLAAVDAAIERGLADADAGLVEDSDRVQRDLLARLGVDVDDG